MTLSNDGHVRFWHKADIGRELVECPLMTDTVEKRF
jgi:hypothetical protein